MRHVLLPLSLVFALAPYVSAEPRCALSPPPPRVAALPKPIPGNIQGNNSSEDVIAAGWYPGWHGSEFPPSQISWSKFNEVKYAFAVTTPDSSVISMTSSDQQIMPQFVAAAHQNGVNASVSIGGWTGSQYFSSAFATPANRTAFAQAVANLISQYKLDAIDLDWEFPGGGGIGCNVVSPNDGANFLLFLQELRKQPVAKNIILSAAVSLKPWVGPDGTPMTDVSGFATVLDYIEIMNYDVWGSWSPSVGPNAPLDDSCAPTQEGSAMSAVKAWTGAGFPAGQIALGVPAYGHSFYVGASAALSSSGQTTALAAYPSFNKALQPHGDRWDDPAGVDQCGNQTPVGGLFNFFGLVQGGFLNMNGTPASGIDFRYDNCSQTPYVYNPNTHVMVSYDDAESFAAKGQYINSAGLAGFAMWDVAGDYNNILLDAISNAMGIESQC